MAFGSMGGLNQGQQQPQQSSGADWLSNILQFLFGQGAEDKQYDLYNPDQQQGFAQILQQALAGLQNNTTDFEPIENQARSDFTQKTIPSIAERFTGLGAQNSSAFANQLGSAGSGLETNLAAMKSGHNLQRQGLLQNLAGLGLTQQKHNVYHPREAGLIENVLGAGAGGLGKAGGMYLANRFGGLGGLGKKSNIVQPEMGS